jgi:hypothetical protein
VVYPKLGSNTFDPCASVRLARSAPTTRWRWW